MTIQQACAARGIAQAAQPKKGGGVRPAFKWLRQAGALLCLIWVIEAGPCWGADGGNSQGTVGIPAELSAEASNASLEVVSVSDPSNDNVIKRWGRKNIAYGEPFFLGGSHNERNWLDFLGIGRNFFRWRVNRIFNGETGDDGRDAAITTKMHREGDLRSGEHTGISARPGMSKYPCPIGMDHGVSGCPRLFHSNGQRFFHVASLFPAATNGGYPKTTSGYGEDYSKRSHDNGGPNHPPLVRRLLLAIFGLLGCYFWTWCACMSFNNKRDLRGATFVGAALLTGWSGAALFLLTAYRWTWGWPL
jgi:hypothetical protein